MKPRQRLISKAPSSVGAMRPVGESIANTPKTKAAKPPAAVPAHQGEKKRLTQRPRPRPTIIAASHHTDKPIQLGRCSAMDPQGGLVKHSPGQQVLVQMVSEGGLSPVQGSFQVIRLGPLRTHLVVDDLFPGQIGFGLAGQG